MKAYRGTEGIPVFILTLLIGGGEWSVSCLGHVMFEERITGSHWLGDWVGCRAVLDVLEKRIISCPYLESNPGLSRS
jgi:hypothetical protein